MSRRKLYKNLVCVCVIMVCMVNGEENGSLFEELEKEGLPRGLVPNTVSVYSLERWSGRLVVHLKKTCYVWVKVEQDHYNVRYKPTISGVLSYGSVSHLSGIAINKKSDFMWWKITEAAVKENGDMEFIVQPLAFSASFPRSHFQHNPVCHQRPL